MMNIETEGLSRAMAMLNTLKAKARIKGIELNNKNREDNSDLNNAEIMDWLAKGGRDFFSLDDELVKLMEKRMVEAIEKELIKQKNAAPRKDPKQGKLTLGNEKAIRQANVVATKAFREAMNLWLSVVTNRIQQQVTASRGRPAALSPQYQVEKEFKHGFTIPIGVATGQLLDNLAPGNRNIKLTK